MERDKPDYLKHLEKWVTQGQIFCFFLGCFSLAQWGLSQEGDRNPNQYLEEIRPLLLSRCSSCHGPEKQEGGLRFDRASSLQRGGDSGSAIVAEQPNDSELWKRIISTGEDRMPPEGDRLSPQQQDMIKTWILDGIPGLQLAASQEEKDPRLNHWAWQPIKRPAIPDISPATSSSLSNPIDAFIEVELKRNGLSFSRESDIEVQLRRLSLDLRGLPLSPDELKYYQSQIDPRSAYSQAIDRWLNDPAYGERWARHWLDISHYADTHGFERDQRRDNAWRYRDYVIDSFNGDRPYDEFVRQQVAGDVLQSDNTESVLASGFLAAGPYDFVGQEETRSMVLRRAARADDLDDMVTQVMTAFCGVTIHCARCHDHKLDPISQNEYYALTAILAGARRADRPIHPEQLELHEAEQKRLRERIANLQSEIAKRRGQGLQLADVVGGGDGFGRGQFGNGVDPASGKRKIDKRGFLENVAVNQFQRSDIPGIDGVLIPDGGQLAPESKAIISSTGLAISIPDTSGQAWDAIRFGPVNSQHSNTLAGIDFSKDHQLLGIHANAAITFDLRQLQSSTPKPFSRFSASVGYFGMTPLRGASVFVYLDGQLMSSFENIGRDDGVLSLGFPIAEENRFLTLMATDSGNGISHDQICFIDPVLESQSKPESGDSEKERIVNELSQLHKNLQQAQEDRKSLKEPDRFYGIRSGDLQEIRRLRRGNPEDPLELVTPGSINCLPLDGQLTDMRAMDGERRIALANWLTHANNPLTARVIVNRLWHYHFGRGLVETPSDFGLGGSQPSHPLLLDWLASELIDHRWSIKHIQRLICSSATYRQSSIYNEKAFQIDSNNRLLWRRSPKRLDAESLRDAILTVSGCIDRRFHGPGYRDFDYQEEYAPVYRYIPATRPDLWRRTIYRFVVRTTTHQFLATLDCPNAANLTPVRDRTTTPLQALALLNNEFMRSQADLFANRLRNEYPEDDTAQISRAFELCFFRKPTTTESQAAAKLIASSGLDSLCLMLFNANEFFYVD
jgi:mono/diheme cytochrome c family protein